MFRDRRSIFGSGRRKAPGCSRAHLVPTLLHKCANGMTGVFVRPYRAISALLAGIFLLNTGFGVIGLITPLRARIDGFPEVAIGLLGSFYYGGMLMGAFAAPSLIGRAGLVGAFAWFATTCAVVALLMPAMVTPWSWLLLRATLGFAFAGLYAVTETWINASATNSNRGALYGIYQIVNYAASLIGQCVLTMEPASSLVGFLVTVALFAVSIAPLLLSKTQPPSVAAQAARPSFVWLARLSPVSFLAAFLVGAANGAHASLAAIYAIDAGFTPESAPWFTMAVSLGSAIGVYPAGRLSDGRDRRKLMMVVAGLGAVVEVALVLTTGNPAALVALGFIGGVLTFSLYTLTVSHANDRATAEQAVLVSSGLLFIYSVGAIGGPALAAVLMRSFGPGALYAQNAAAHLLLAIFALVILMRRAPATPGRRARIEEVNAATPFNP
jgi:MFS family permease